MTKNIILIHGWGSNIQKLKPLSQELKKIGWNPYTPKLPFFDLPEPKNAWSVSDFAKFIEQEAHKQFNNQPYYLFGHSNGGRITIKLASQKNKKLQGIILCASAGIFRDSSIKLTILKLINTLLKPFKNLPYYHKIRKLPYLLARNYDYYKINSEIKKATFRLIIEEDLKSNAKSITLPTLILWGTNDKLTPIKAAHWLNKNLQKPTLKTYPRQPHTLPYNLPQQLARDIDQWSSTT